MASMMEGFVAPIFHRWYHQNSIISSPDNGILYCSRYDIAYIPPLDKNCLPKTQIIKINGFIKSLACSPDWTAKRLFATLDEYNNLYVWDLDLEQPIHGHRGHAAAPKALTSKKQFADVTSAICFSSHGKVISSDRSDLAVYCLLTDSYKFMPDFFRNKAAVTIVPSPVDRDVFIAGLKDGLIQIFSIKKMTIVHTLRSHDKEIVSIECMNVPVLKSTVWRKRDKPEAGTSKVTESATKNVENRPKKQARKKAVPVADDSDFLDIYDFNESQEEFGTIIDRETQDEKRNEFREKAKTVEGFNFLEACENLKEDILKAANRRDDEEEEDEEVVERSAIAQDDFNTDDENDLDDCEKLRDYVVVDSADREAEVEPEDEREDYESKLILVSGSRENVVWFWDYETGLPIDKIVIPSDANARLCDTLFTTVVWVDESHVVANNSNGQVIEWKVAFKYKNDRLQLVAQESLAPYPVEKIFQVIRANGLTKTETNGRYLWCSSIHRKISCLEVAESGKASVIVDYACITPTNRCVVENPLESMVIALASGAPRIEKLNLASLQHDNIPFKSFFNKLSGLVMFLAWHPEEEDKLAFATNEGRIGVLDTSSMSNFPVIMKPFTNKEVYALHWCYLTDDKQEKRLVLFACGKNELAYYHMSGVHKYEPMRCKQFGQVSNISGADNMCFIGTQQGTIYISDLDQNLKQLYHQKVAKRYISSVEYKQNHLAVGSNDHVIRMINISDGFGGEQEKEIITLEGHTDGICKLRWNRGDSMLLLSTSYDCTIRVWDALSATCLNVFYTKSIAYGAIFSPLDDNIILFVGKGIPLTCYNYTKQHEEVSKVSTKPPKIKLASLEDSNPTESKQGNKRGRANKKANAVAVSDGNTVNEAVDQLTDEVKKVTLKENATVKPATLSTTFQLTHRETNKTKDVLECIVKLLHTPEPEPEPTDLEGDENSSDNDSLDEEFNRLTKPKSSQVNHPVVEPAVHQIEVNSQDEKMFYNERLFSTEQNLKQLIEEEAKMHTITDTSSIGLVMLPQLLHKLKDTILGCISKKKLTPQMLALAPYVSHMFWRQCCQAYAYQLIEGQQPLAAVPFFLASHKIDSSIEELCDAKYFREAWVICRLQKMPEDPILEQVASRWAHHLDAIGNYEGAALVWTGVKKYKEAIEVLMKRRDITEDIQRTIDELNAKLLESAKY
uniref:WD repeat-containing protein 55 homolog n=1 Tax=Anopheles christyi TaxID=43041 RepID=A0A182K4Q5_9DIPT